MAIPPVTQSVAVPVAAGSIQQHAADQPQPLPPPPLPQSNPSATTAPMSPHAPCLCLGRSVGSRRAAGCWRADTRAASPQRLLCAAPTRRHRGGHGGPRLQRGHGGPRSRGAHGTARLGRREGSGACWGRTVGCCLLSRVWWFYRDKARTHCIVCARKVCFITLFVILSSCLGCLAHMLAPPPCSLTRSLIRPTTI